MVNMVQKHLKDYAPKDRVPCPHPQCDGIQQSHGGGAQDLVACVGPSRMSCMSFLATCAFSAIVHESIPPSFVYLYQHATVEVTNQ